LPENQISANPGVGPWHGLFHSLHQGCIAAMVFAIVASGSDPLELDRKKIASLQYLNKLPLF
jgi:hypothetical protein